jgi:excisionase family DNA binding protein
MTEYVSPKEAKIALGISDSTLRRWAKDNKIDFITTDGGHRRYNIKDKQEKKGEKIIYARVSSKKQEHDLQRQIKLLTDRYPDHTIVSDIASGINYKRKGLTAILDKLFARNISEVVVYSKDRLSRFGFDLFEYLFKSFGAKLIVESNTTEKSSEEELAEDLLSVVTVFTARYHDSRKYKNKSKD